MDARKINLNGKIQAKRNVTEEDSKAIIKKICQQPLSANKQPAQERLKRLQSNLKPINNKKPDKESVVPKRVLRSNSSNTSSSSYSTNCTTTNACTKPQSTASSYGERVPTRDFRNYNTLKTKTVLPKSSSTTKVTNTTNNITNLLASYNEGKANTLKNTWEKPNVLLNASKKEQRNGSINANQRLAQLRASLHETQKRNNNNNNITNANNNTDVVMISNNQKRVAATTAMSPKCDKTVKSNVLPISNFPIYDEAEPMDIDFDEPEKAVEDEAENVKSNDIEATKTSDATLVCLHRNDEELPSRLMDHKYFVLDTNVLMYNLTFVDELSRLSLGNSGGSMLFIPYIVIRELDRLKIKRDNNEVRCAAAVRAIRYLNEKFDNSLNIQAQSALEESEHLIDVDCGDDSIVNCCIQLKEQVPQIMLLTNDANLRLKANASSIKVARPNDLLSEYRDKFDALPS